MAYELQTDWESLYLGALYRASTIITTREKFAEMIQDQMIEFNEELVKFVEDFKNNGPGSVKDDLDLGVQKMIVRLNTCFILYVYEDSILYIVINGFLFF